MKKNVTRHILSAIILFFIIALLPSEFTMILGSAVFATAALGLPFKALLGGAVICTWIFSLTSADFGTGILLSLAFIIPGWIEGVLLRRRRSLSAVISVTAIARSGLLLLCYDRMASAENTTIKEFIFGDIPERMLNELKIAGESEEVIELMGKMLEMMENMLPSAIVATGLSFAFLSLACTKFMTRNMPLVFLGMRKFSDIRIDISFTVCAIIISALACFETNMQVVFINCLYVIYVVYTAAGFAFVYRLIKKGIKDYTGIIIALVTFMVIVLFSVSPIWIVIAAIITGISAKSIKEVKK